MFRPPLESTGRVACANAAGGLNRFSILLAFGDVDNLASSSRLDNLGQAVRQTLDTLQVPYPAAPSIRPALTEVLWLKPNDLKDEVPERVPIVVGRDDLLIGTTVLGVLGEQ